MIQSPKSVYDFLNLKVCGQERAKRVLANELFKHSIRFDHNTGKGARNIRNKSTYLLTGPTGCGKTYLIDVLDEIGAFPVFKIDATTLTKTGFYGMTIEDHLRSCYYQLEGENKKLTMNYAIIFIDEIDKICMNSEANGSWNSELQYSLLTLLQGIDVHINDKVTISTENMMFILGGNFKNMRVYRAGLNKPSMGFVDQKVTERDSSTPHKELFKAGVIDELAGRITDIINLDELTKKELRDILVKKEDSTYKQYQLLFSSIGYDVTLSNYYINKIVEKCHKNGTGARGLQTELDRILEEYIFNMQQEP